MSTQRSLSHRQIERENAANRSPAPRPSRATGRDPCRRITRPAMNPLSPHRGEQGESSSFRYRFFGKEGEKGRHDQQSDLCLSEKNLWLEKLPSRNTMEHSYIVLGILLPMNQQSPQMNGRSSLFSHLFPVSKSSSPCFFSQKPVYCYHVTLVH